ncbi:MAG: acyl-protein synthase [Oligoflexia bacterium]|nr:acyl-protein synthase [Oligoflexia bacterium]
MSVTENNLAINLNFDFFHLDFLCKIEQPYLDYNEKIKIKNQEISLETLFIKAMVENLNYHLLNEKSGFIKNLFLSKNFLAEKILDNNNNNSGNRNGISTIPFILANFFKRHKLLSIDENKVFLHLTSSGTTGEKSQVFFDEWSISIAQKMVDRIFKYYNFISEEKTNYLLYTYEPEGAANIGTAYTDNFLCKYAPIENVFYALKYVGTNEENKSSKHKFDVFGTIRTLKEYEQAGLPVRIFGFPSFLYFTLKRMQELKYPALKLNKNSMTFLGGGWKGHQDQAISKDELYALIEKMLGIPNERLRDGFGSAEHCIPYVECPKHQLHVPIWSRVIIRDIKTLKPLPYGETGFLQLISPYITSMPAMSVLMSDLASLHAGESCCCGLKTPYFIHRGRAQVSKSMSCAIAASELLKAEV